MPLYPSCIFTCPKKEIVILASSTITPYHFLLIRVFLFSVPISLVTGLDEGLLLINFLYFCCWNLERTNLKCTGKVSTLTSSFKEGKQLLPLFLPYSWSQRHNVVQFEKKFFTVGCRKVQWQLLNQRYGYYSMHTLSEEKIVLF